MKGVVCQLHAVEGFVRSVADLDTWFAWSGTSGVTERLLG